MQQPAPNKYPSTDGELQIPDDMIAIQEFEPHKGQSKPIDLPPLPPTTKQE